ncbi:MAG: hypothetical protein ABIH22_00980 [Candidatus Margulisiibacteriota bacterium]
MNKTPIGISKKLRYNTGILSNSFKNTLAHIKGFVLVSLIILFALNLPSPAAQENDFVVYKGKRYDSSYFFKISGTVQGQAAPGVQEVQINGIIVPVDQNYIFNSNVTLAKGQKYLIIETKYKGLRFIKKYLVIRHPKAQKTFALKVSEKEFKELAKKEPPKKEEQKKKAAPTKIEPVIKKAKPSIRKPVKKPAKKGPAPKVIVEKLPSQVIAEKPPALPKPKVKPSWLQNLLSWLGNKMPKQEAPLRKTALIPTEEAHQIIRKEAIIIVEQEAPGIIGQETQKYLARELPPDEAKKLFEKQAKKILPPEEAKKIMAREAEKFIKEETSKEELLKILNKEAPQVLEKEVKKILERDVPPGKGLQIVSKEIHKLINSESPKIIKNEINLLLQKKLADEETIRLIEKKVSDFLDKDKLWQIAQDTAKKEALKSVDKDALRNIVENTIRNEIRNFIAKEAPHLIEGEFQKIKEKAAKQEARREAEAFQPAKIISIEGQQPYDLIMEIDDNKIFLIKLVNGKYHGYLYLKDKKAWFPLQEISSEELNDLMEEGTLPASFKP